MKRALIVALACAGSCSESPAPVPQPVAQTQTTRRPVAREELAKVMAEFGAPVPPAEIPDELRERAQGLLETLAGTDAAMRRLARTELRDLGPAVAPLLAARLADDAAAPAQLEACAEILGEFDTPEAAEALLARIEAIRTRKDTAPWLRTQCAWRLGSGTQDWVVPRLILHLRYETDHETVAWIARTLAHFGNFAGLDGLYVIWRTGRTPEMRDLAAQSLGLLASEHGFPDSDALLRAWVEGDPEQRLHAPPLSPLHRREIWARIAGFSEWQLRGVDDARFTLARESREATPLLALALEDENRYVRIHAAQTLERLGRRALAAGPALMRALDDAEIAPQAAETLGAVGYREAESALSARLGPDQPIDLRTSAARALGKLALSSSLVALEPWTKDDVQLDLRVAASCARVRCSPADVPRPLLESLLRHMTSGQVDSAEPENALALWLAAQAQRDQERFGDAARRWTEVAGDDPPLRVGERAELLRGLFAPQR